MLTLSKISLGDTLHAKISAKMLKQRAYSRLIFIFSVCLFISLKYTMIDDFILPLQLTVRLKFPSENKCPYFGIDCSFLFIVCTYDVNESTKTLMNLRSDMHECTFQC